jgi:2-methylisocitrate lyase-like PEP mutase family enzyme
MAGRFRGFLDAPGMIELPGSYDVLSAILLEVGFAAVFLSGYGVAASFFGNPDIGLTSPTETARLAKNVADAVRMPLVGDADDAYGNGDNVIRTVYELEYAAPAAVTIEDQVFPKRCGHAANKTIVPLGDYLRKLECALRARQTQLVIIARTDAVDVEEAITRAKAFHAAGADVVLAHGLKSLADLARVGREVPRHKQVNLIYGGKTPILSAPEPSQLAFKIVLYSARALYVATHAVFKQMRTLQETNDLKAISVESVTFPDFQRLIETRYMKRRDGNSHPAATTAVA